MPHWACWRRRHEADALDDREVGCLRPRLAPLGPECANFEAHLSYNSLAKFAIAINALRALHSFEVFDIEKEQRIMGFAAEDKSFGTEAADQKAAASKQERTGCGVILRTFFRGRGDGLRALAEGILL